jgi:hypothetical protein
MANESKTTISYEEFNNGRVDMKGTEDIPINTELYVVSNDTVTAVPASTTTAVLAKRLGWCVRPYTHGEDNVVGVQSKFNRRVHRTVATGATVAAGDWVKFDTTVPTTIRPWVWGNDEATKVGLCLKGAVPAATAEIAEE